jgi:formamidopyrimidine-DNA glycosylase
MPEMPEVETIRRGLLKRILNKRITRVQVRKPKIVRGKSASFSRQLQGQTFTAIDRRGKLLAFALADGNHLLIHLKMTGQLIYQFGRSLLAGGHPWPKIEQLPNQYSHVILDFADTSRLFFNDQRQFGYMQIVPEEQKQLIWHTYGPEPLDPAFTAQEFHTALRKRSTTLKAALLNQQVVAGLGNIYVDEICFAAGVLPYRSIRTLTDDEIAALYRSCRMIIKKALKYRGTTFSDYVDDEGKQGGFTKLLKVYGREGERCRRCKIGVIEKVQAAGRGTHYCPNCQH